MTDKKPNDETDKLYIAKNDEFVLTPGGRRLRKFVKQVGPDEAIIRNEDGTYSIVPKKQFNKVKKKNGD